MRIPSIYSLFLGFTLLMTVVSPHIAQQIFGQPSLGVFFISIFYITLFFISINFLKGRLYLNEGVFFVFSVLFYIVVHGFIEYCSNTQFDTSRFLDSFLFLLAFLMAVRVFVLFVQKIPASRSIFAFNFVFYVLLFTSIGGIFHVSLLSQDYVKPVLFFTEPSHYALAFSPFLLYKIIISDEKMHWLLMFLGFAIGLILQNLIMLVVMCFITLIIVPFRRLFWVLLVGTGIVVFFMPFLDMTYYTSRLDFSGDTNNLSALVYMSGWQRAYFDLIDSSGLGVGYNQFGVVGREGDLMQKLGDLGFPGLNAFDGGSTAPKLIGEFGVLGLLVLVVYCMYFVRFFAILKRLSLDPIVAQAHYKEVFFYSCYLMYAVELFFRGIGYFTVGGFFFWGSVLWFFLIDLPSKSTNKSFLKIRFPNLQNTPRRQCH